MTEESEISTPQPITEPKLSFGQRLRAALETLEPGNAILLKTKEDRQTITNAVLAVKKKKGFNLTTRLAESRGDDGKMVVEIKRLA